MSTVEYTWKSLVLKIKEQMFLPSHSLSSSKASYTETRRRRFFSPDRVYVRLVEIDKKPTDSDVAIITMRFRNFFLSLQCESAFNLVV